MYSLLRSMGLACLVSMMVVAVGMTDDETTQDTKTTKDMQDTKTTKGTQDIVDTAMSAGTFNTFASALAAVDLIETLKGEGPFTVFMPTDEAFEKIPKDILAELLMPEHKERLAIILTYHIVPGTLMAGDLADKPKVKTVEGSEIDVKSADGKLFVDEAIVTEADIECENGVIHVIDTLIIPDD